MKIIHTPEDKLLQLEASIYCAVDDRINKDADVADCYLRINPDTFDVSVMYIEESLGTGGERDIALLNLMEEVYNEEYQCEDFYPNVKAIHRLAQSYSNMIEMSVCQN